ncbi:hypothetical protein KJ359_006271 [Pestalotiopsis sp. 9143b]|nr:hypothetical protein KJ359_006271 [Pestalotiopsis sp. 9143b]
MTVQAALNVVISVLSTIGMWAFSRFWWQRVSFRILHTEDGVPLSRLLLVSGPGEGWDVIKSLGRRLLSKENWPLLTQIFVVMCVSVISALSGPIAKASLHRGSTIIQRDQQILPALKGQGLYGALIREDVLWNMTGAALNTAHFPLDQLLDKVPTSSPVPWTYAAEEWDPTWTIRCNYTNGINVPNVTASGEYLISEPLDVFPAFKDTYDPVWLNSSEYRVSSGFNGIADWTAKKQFSNAMFFVLVQSEPETRDRMSYNNETLNLSMSVFYLRDFAVLTGEPSAAWAGVSWRPIGPASDAIYSRAECAITRKASVPDEERIPWPWTNDTLSIVAAYSPYFDDSFTKAALKNQTVGVPTGQDLIRLYQVYMATLSTYYSDPLPGVLSSIVDTVELSIAFLVVVLFLVILTIFVAIRYRLFMRKNKIKIEETCVPDGKIDWIVHAAKISELGSSSKGPANEQKKHNDREYLQNSTFGQVVSAYPATPQADAKTTNFARVKPPRVMIQHMSSNRSSSTYHPALTQADPNGHMDDDSQTIIVAASSPLTESHVIRRTSNIGSDDPNSAQNVHGSSLSSTAHDSISSSANANDYGRLGAPDMRQVSLDDTEGLVTMVPRRETV